VQLDIHELAGTGSFDGWKMKNNKKGADNQKMRQPTSKFVPLNQACIWTPFIMVKKSYASLVRRESHGEKVVGTSTAAVFERGRKRGVKSATKNDSRPTVRVAYRMPVAQSGVSSYYIRPLPMSVAQSVCSE
jgi:hypothetical protein